MTYFLNIITSKCLAPWRNSKIIETYFSIKVEEGKKTDHKGTIFNPDTAEHCEFYILDSDIDKIFK